MCHKLSYLVKFSHATGRGGQTVRSVACEARSRARSTERAGRPPTVGRVDRPVDRVDRGPGPLTAPAKSRGRPRVSRGFRNRVDRGGGPTKTTTARYSRPISFFWTTISKINSVRREIVFQREIIRGVREGSFWREPGFRSKIAKRGLGPRVSVDHPCWSTPVHSEGVARPNPRANAGFQWTGGGPGKRFEMPQSSTRTEIWSAGAVGGENIQKICDHGGGGPISLQKFATPRTRPPEVAAASGRVGVGRGPGGPVRARGGRGRVVGWSDPWTPWRAKCAQV